jgi:hypothetical protein
LKENVAEQTEPVVFLWNFQIRMIVQNSRGIVARTHSRPHFLGFLTEGKPKHTIKGNKAIKLTQMVAEVGTNLYPGLRGPASGIKR